MLLLCCFLLFDVLLFCVCLFVVGVFIVVSVFDVFCWIVCFVFVLF